MHRAVVATISPLTVVLHGSASPAPAQHLDSYAPALNDQVRVLVDGRELLVLGSVT